MTIRKRLVLWYAAILTVSLFLISLGTYHEIREQARNERHGRPVEPAMEETSEMVFQVGLPALALGIAGGWWLTRRALAPVAALTKTAQRITEQNLSDPLPRTGNGDELDKLAGVLNDMNSRLNASFMRIHEFTLRASHELKTPLTILCGEAETALRDESLTPADRERLASQLEELRRLARIV
ncbi:MAG TPA: HAMP domain-containing protein, partial [Verrucomicrobiae bacterium]|nr:HAMP domain-containing protein [Verrucomicrobiae bacterium]